MIGRKISHYSVTAKLGEGGMGEVYRATDTKLGRDVALKVLPEAFASDAERMARFEREAQVLASLNHSNIATIHGLEEAGGVRCLVLELVEGPTLAQRIAKGPLPLEEALPIARQVAEALEAAHDRGVIHRDLKPGNIKVTPEGHVKVLDFGLAKAFGPEETQEDISKSPTLTMAATRAGVILGTAAYMSPEQAHGRRVDRRADIWGFGAVVYEMLTGKQAFRGESISDTLASVLKLEPDWEALPAETPAPIRKLLRRCLEKNPKRRLQAIGEARITLEDFLAHPETLEAQEARPVATRPRWQDWRLWAAVTGALAVVLLLLLWSPRGVEAPAGVTRLGFELPATQVLEQATDPAVVLSADGRLLVYRAIYKGAPQLFLRPLDRFEATPIPGTENARFPFLSPDGKWVGFAAEGKLKKAPLGGGPVTALAEVAVDLSGARGATWGPDDTIVYSPDATTSLLRIPASGGTPQPLTTLDPAKQERTHRLPQFLPGGKAVLFTVGTQDSPDYYDNARIDAVVLGTGERRTLLESASIARCLPGYLLFSRDRTLLAVPFDVDRLQVTGPPVSLVEGVAGDITTGAVHFAVSNSGNLAYVPGDVAGALYSLAWADRSGNFRPLSLPAKTYLDPMLSPDGRRLAVVIASGKDYDIWIHDLERGTLSRLTFGGSNRSPHWTPDGQRVIYATTPPDGRSTEIQWKPADGSGPAASLARIEDRAYVESVSPDGQWVTFGKGVGERGENATNIWYLPLQGEHQPQLLEKSPFSQYLSSFSPDGRWLAYSSAESGRYEVYVRPFPGPGGKWQVSTEGGLEPRWSRDGRELFYRSEVSNRVMSVPVETGTVFKPGTPRPLFEGVFNLRTETNAVYSVSPDAERFLVIRPSGDTAESRTVAVVLNVLEQLRRLTHAQQ